MYLLDTWAWVEYFSGTPLGEKIQPTVEAGDHATSVLTIAELSDKFRRDGYDDPDTYLAYVSRTARILAVTEPIARQASATKHRQRDAGHPMGLVDALIYETAQDHGLVVLTGDPDFEGLDGVETVDGPGAM